MTKEKGREAWQRIVERERRLILAKRRMASDVRYWVECLLDEGFHFLRSLWRGGWFSARVAVLALALGDLWAVLHGARPVPLSIAATALPIVIFYGLIAGSFTFVFTGIRK